jgi:hypothetical protein
MNSVAFERHCQLFFQHLQFIFTAHGEHGLGRDDTRQHHAFFPASTRRRFGSVRTAAFLLSAVMASIFPQRYPRIATASAAQLDDELLSAAAGFASPPPPPDPVKKVS